MKIVWIMIGVAGVIALLGGLARFISALRAVPRGDDIPATPLERLGWIGLWVSAGIGLGTAVLVAVNGATDFYANDTSRGIFTLMLMGGLAIWFVAWRVIGRASGTAVVDERDRAILARSFSVESVLVILSLVAWTVTLTEVYWEEGAVPIGYLQLIFWSTFIVGAFGRSLGIVLGYRREPLVDA